MPSLNQYDNSNMPNLMVEAFRNGRTDGLTNKRKDPN